MYLKNKNKISLLTFAGIMLIAMIIPSALQACPGCGAALTGELGKGFNYSILYMMAMPFLVFGSVAVGIVYVTRKNKNRTSCTSYAKNKEETN